MDRAVRLCVAVDIEGYRHRSLTGQRRAQADLVSLLDAMWRDVGRAERQARGDGEVAVAPAGADHSSTLSQVATVLRSGLGALDDGGERRLRLRVAAHVGHVEAGANGFVGLAVVRTCRMLDSAPLRAALDEHPAAHLALMVSEPVLEDVVSRELHLLRAADFRAVDVREPAKSFVSRAWIHVPDGPAAPAEAPADHGARFRVDVAPGGHVGTIVQVGELHGGIDLGGRKRRGELP